VRNAFNDEVIAELTAVFLETRQARRGALHRAGRQRPAFCAGADLNWMKRMAEYTREENIEDARRSRACWR
jgi:methylglutaconyl-CoA hydratase